MERRRETEGIETVNSLLNQKVNWKSGEFRLPAETVRGGGQRKSGGEVSEKADDKGRRAGQM